MIERKSHKADLERQRPKLLALSFLISTALFFSVLLIPAGIKIAIEYAEKEDDSTFDMEMLALEKPEDNIVAAKLHEEPKLSEKLNKVDEVAAEQPEQLELKFTPNESDELEKMKDEEAEPIAPPITDMNNLPIDIVEQLPEYPGGMVEFMKWLTKTLRYPADARVHKIEGKVKVQFVVEKDGQISVLKITESDNTIFNGEALRVMKSMPKWKPGISKGKPCRTVVNVPIVFAL